MMVKGVVFQKRRKTEIWKHEGTGKKTTEVEKELQVREIKWGKEA